MRYAHKRVAERGTYGGRKSDCRGGAGDADHAGQEPSADN